MHCKEESVVVVEDDVDTSVDAHLPPTQPAIVHVGGKLFYKKDCKKEVTDGQRDDKDDRRLTFTASTSAEAGRIEKMDDCRPSSSGDHVQHVQYKDSWVGVVRAQANEVRKEGLKGVTHAHNMSQLKGVEVVHSVDDYEVEGNVPSQVHQIHHPRQAPMGTPVKKVQP